MTKRNWTYALIPLILALGVVGGIFIGKKSSSSSLSPEMEKMMMMMDIIKNEYVDEVDLDSIMEGSYSQMMSLLDPHSVYIPSEDLETVNDELEGSFSGVGVSFQIMNDTVNVIEIVTGGPAEKVGLMAGDKIIKVDDKDLTGTNATNENVYKNLRGPKGTEVTVTVVRNDSKKPLNFKVTRDDVPQNSVDAQYMIADNIGYIKVGKFARTTYEEFYKALQALEARGAEKFVIDLRGNSGGFMDQAILMANEFLPRDRSIVYTKGRNPLNDTYAASNGAGHYLDNELVVLTDEFSASASEIFAGAIQDNDRGLVIGRRTFGKGLVQNQIPLPDNSAIRLTVARYYTPSGRSIQKEYKRGEGGKYDMDISERYNHGEFYNVDSIKLDKSKVFYTVNNRKVYGGGGIMPDLFVPQDTTGYSSYYTTVNNNGLIQKYAYQVANKYRSVLKDVKSVDQLMKVIPRDETLLEGFVDFAALNGVPARWFYIRKSQDRILHELKSIIARDALGYGQFFQYYNRNDNVINQAVKTLKEGKSPVNIIK